MNVAAGEMVEMRRI